MSACLLEWLGVDRPLLAGTSTLGGCNLTPRCLRSGIRLGSSATFLLVSTCRMCQVMPHPNWMAAAVWHSRFILKLEDLPLDKQLTVAKLSLRVNLRHPMISLTLEALRSDDTATRHSF